MEAVLTAGEPATFSQDERRHFCELVELGGEVDTIALEQNVTNARALVFARSNGRVLGVGAIKRPKSTYREKVANDSGFNLSCDLYPFELGYIFVQEEARGWGLSHQIVSAALNETDGQNIFATARADNQGMLRALCRASFLQVGHDYSGRNSRTLIRLLVKNR
jgi:predicted GNAT family N-acyltransferase